MKRYHMQEGSNPELQASFHVAGPQNSDQVAREIRELLDQNGIQQVAVFYNHGLGDRVVIYQKITDEKASHP